MALDRVARTEETERTGHQVRQALARYSQPSITEIVQQQQQQEQQQQQQHGREKLTEEEKAFRLEQRLLRIPSRVLRRLRGQAPQVATQFQEQKLEQDQDQDGKQQQEQEPRKGAQSAFRAEVGGTKEKNAKDKNTDKEYDVYEDDDDDDDDDDELEDEDDKKGQKAGGADRKEKEKEVASVMQLAQFDSASSRRSKAIDSERVPIEYNPSEVAVSRHFLLSDATGTNHRSDVFYDMPSNILFLPAFLSRPTSPINIVRRTGRNRHTKPILQPRIRHWLLRHMGDIRPCKLFPEQSLFHHRPSWLPHRAI